MRICTKRWTKLAARGRFRFDAKARINNKDYTVISAPRIDRSLYAVPAVRGQLHIGYTESVDPHGRHHHREKAPLSLWAV